MNLFEEYGPESGPGEGLPISKGRFFTSGRLEVCGRLYVLSPEDGYLGEAPPRTNVPRVGSKPRGPPG